MPGIMPLGRTDHHELHGIHPSMAGVPAALGERAAHSLPKTPFCHSLCFFVTCAFHRHAGFLLDFCRDEPGAVQVGPQ